MPHDSRSLDVGISLQTNRAVTGVTALTLTFFCRVDFRCVGALPQDAKPRQFLRVKEGAYENRGFRPICMWNGDQTDWGLNFGSEPQVLRVKLGT